jgi:hypothetical protein
MPARSITNLLIPSVIIGTYAFVLFSNRHPSFEMNKTCGENGPPTEKLSGTSGTLFTADRIRHFPLDERLNLAELSPRQWTESE